MKTKLLILSILVLTFSINLQAQFSWGLRGGVTSSNMNLSDNGTSSTQLTYDKGTFGWHVGLIGQVKVAKIFVQPELLFSTAKFDLKYTNINDPSQNKLGEQKIRKLDLPVMLGFKVAIFKLQAGPVGTLILNSKSDLLDEKKIDQNLQSVTFGYQAGVGLELSSLLLDFKYEGNLSKLGNEVKFNTTKVKTDQRMRQFVFSIGYLF
jgi:hypothetical protein